MSCLCIFSISPWPVENVAVQLRTTKRIPAYANAVEAFNSVVGPVVKFAVTLAT